MAIYFLDSSALLKRYVVEPGTSWVQSLFGPGAGHRLVIVSISAVEVVAAVARRARAGGLSTADASRIISAFRTDVSRDFDLIHTAPPVIDNAMRAAERHGLRGYDAVQLAAALAITAPSLATSAGPITLVSADLELNAAARVEGLLVEDPNTHP